MDPDRLDALLADAVAEQAGRARAEERILRQAAEEEATFLGTLVELAERGDTVTIRMSTGRSHRGAIVAVGRDFAAVQDGEHAPAFLVVRSITSIRAGRIVRHDTAGARMAPLNAGFAVVLAGLAAARPTVNVGITGEAALLLGELRAVGQDVVTLRLDSSSTPTLYLPIGAVAEVVVLEL